MVHILLMLKALFTFKDIFVKLLLAVKLACSSAIISSGLALSLFKTTFIDFFQMTDEADGSVVLIEL